MKTLITGVDGFIGGWLARLVVERGDEVVGISRRDAAARGGVRRVVADLADAGGVAKAVADAKPDRIFHLAAANHIPTSFERPAETFTVNAIGTMHLLAAVRSNSSTDHVTIARRMSGCVPAQARRPSANIRLSSTAATSMTSVIPNSLSLVRRETPRCIPRRREPPFRHGCPASAGSPCGR